MSTTGGGRKRTKAGTRPERPQGTRRHRCCIVALGASAGGLEAFQKFFTHTPPDTGFGFVVVSHLDPEHSSIMPELMAKYSTMPVREITDNMAVEPDHIYIIPPNTELSIYGGVLRLAGPSKPRGYRMPIDRFFRSLAEDQGNNAICVVLSGSGSDGTLGLRAVKEHGGAAVVQDPETARFPDMPRSAVATGLADRILPVEEIPSALAEITAGLSERQEQQDSDAIREEAQQYLDEICLLLRNRTGHDFSRYKQGTMLRRISRRMQIVGVRTVADYLLRIREEPKEIEHLFRDLLIGVTYFFRDSEAFDVLAAEVLPSLLEGKGASDQVRIWVPGCASGEEAYSIAMLLKERSPAGEGPQFQIFATDIDPHALDTARHARYPMSIVDQISAERLERFFYLQGDQYILSREIREMCVFSPHNVIKDPPFSRLDLISCRNLMIYLEGELQKRLIPLFHYALNPGGYLFLGPSESVVTRSELFRAVDKKHRIFRRKETIIRSQVSFPLDEPRRAPNYTWENPPRAPFTREQNLGRTIERVLLENYAPASVIINEQSEALYFSGRTGSYLEPATGMPSHNLLNMARKGLRLELRTAIHKAVTSNQEVIHEDVVVDVPGGIARINLIVRPMRELGDDCGLFMVVFQEVVRGHEQGEIGTVSSGEEPGIVQQLEFELRTVKEHLQTTIEELETSNEELKSSNEELISMNEELQSANEELQTSKEELQSVNEELQSVNGDLVEKIEELNRANSDVQNLFESTEIATIFLSNDLRIKKFTPAAVDLFHLIEGDIGRPVTDIAPRFSSGELTADIREVLRTLSRREMNVHRAEGNRSYIMRILPYRTVDNVIDGVVITFNDITEQKRAQEYRGRLGAIVESSRDAIVSMTLDGIVETWNSGAELMYGYTATEMIGGTINRIVPPELMSQREDFLVPMLRGEQLEPFESVRIRRDGTRVAVSVTMSPVRDLEGKIIGSSTISRDISDRKRAEQALRESEERFRVMADSAPVKIWMADTDKLCYYFNRRWLRFTGRTVEEELGTGWTEGVHPDDRKRCLDTFVTAFDRREEFVMDFRLRRHDGEYRWLLDHGVPLFTPDGTFTGYIGSSLDITDRKLAEEKIRASEQVLNDFFENATVGLHWVADDGTIIRANRAELEMLGYTADEYIGHNIMEFHVDREVAEDILKRLADGEVLKDYEAHLRCHNGSVREVIINTSAYSQNGRFIHSRCFTRDVTDRNAALRGLTESEQRYRTLFETTLDGILLVNDTGIYIDVNSSFCNLLKTSKEELIGTHFSRYIPQEATAAAERAFEELKSTGWFKGEFPLLDSEGNLVELEWVSRANFMPGFHYCTARDISARKLAERELWESRERLRVALDAADMGAWRWDLRSDLDTRDASLNRIVGLEPVVSNQPVEDYVQRIHPDDRMRVTRTLQEALGNRALYSSEYRIVRPDGTIRWVRDRGRVVLDMHGRPEFMTGAVADITDRKLSEEALRISRERLDLIVSSTEIGLWYCDLPFDKLIWNDRCKEHFGLPAETEVSIDDFYAILHPDDRERTRIAIERSIGRHTMYDVDYRTVGTDGRVRWIRAIGSPFFNEEGTPVRFDGLTIDITEQKLNEETLQAAKMQLSHYAEELEQRVAERTSNLQETVRSLESFTYSIAHDLRAPLRAVQGYTSILLEDYSHAFDDTGRDFARRITGAAEHMDHLIQDLLAFGRLSHIDIVPVPLDLNEQMDMLMMQMREEIRAKGASVTIVQPLPTVLAHSTALGQVVTNLISNALKFVPKGVVPSVVVSAETHGNRMRLYVEDNGIGIDPTHRERIFGVFERLHGSSEYPGTGIGLAIVRKGMERMGGKAGVESEPGKGSRFWIELPTG